MNSIILHIDFNSYFATVEQQANPRLRGKPIGVTGGDRTKRTVIGAASVEAKKYGVKTGMRIPEALKLCPNLILVKGDSDKYLSCTKKFLNILKNYSPYLEVFSIDEVFLELYQNNSEGLKGFEARNVWGVRGGKSIQTPHPFSTDDTSLDTQHRFSIPNDAYSYAIAIAQDIKEQIKQKVGSWITVSIGISYNKRMAKLAGSLYKPDGLVVLADPQASKFILDRIELDEICGIGGRIKKRLNNMGVFSFKDLRAVPLPSLLASFKSYGQVLYEMARGEDFSPIVPFYEKEEVKSVGHRHTISHDVSDPLEIKQILLKLTELIARKLRQKKLAGKTISLYYRKAFDKYFYDSTGSMFDGNGMQLTIPYTDDGLEIFSGAWRAFNKLWQKESIRMVGVSISNLKPAKPENLSLLDQNFKHDRIIKALDTINNKYGEFTLKRGILLGTPNIYRKPNSFLSDRRFKI
jgi:DNA polymerase IV